MNRTNLKSIPSVDKKVTHSLVVIYQWRYMDNDYSIDFIRTDYLTSLSPSLQVSHFLHDARRWFLKSLRLVAIEPCSSTFFSNVWPKNSINEPDILYSKLGCCGRLWPFPWIPLERNWASYIQSIVTFYLAVPFCATRKAMHNTNSEQVWRPLWNLMVCSRPYSVSFQSEKRWPIYVAWVETVTRLKLLLY